MEQSALAWLASHLSLTSCFWTLEMPRMNGWEFLQAADRAELLRGTRIVMLTGRSNELRLLDWVSKPAIPDSLIKRIRFHIRTT